jgi:flagellar operon protein
MNVDPASHVAPLPALRPGRPVPGGAAPGTSFQDALRDANRDLSLSRHAQKRLDRRDLDLDPARLDRLQSAVERAAAKGSRSSLVVLDDLAVVVDVRDRKVVTAMSREGGRDRVFTNIDSVVFG